MIWKEIFHFLERFGRKNPFESFVNGDVVRDNVFEQFWLDFSDWLIHDVDFLALADCAISPNQRYDWVCFFDSRFWQYFCPFDVQQVQLLLRIVLFIGILIQVFNIKKSVVPNFQVSICKLLCQVTIPNSHKVTETELTRVTDLGRGRAEQTYVAFLASSDFQLGTYQQQFHVLAVADWHFVRARCTVYYALRALLDADRGRGVENEDWRFFAGSDCDLLLKIVDCCDDFLSSL